MLGVALIHALCPLLAISMLALCRGIASEDENDGSVCANVFGLWWSQ
jgi:hypothetical protein